MKHPVEFQEHKYPDYPAGERTTYSAWCHWCLWYREHNDEVELARNAEEHINLRRRIGYPKPPPHRKEKR